MGFTATFRWPHLRLTAFILFRNGYSRLCFVRHAIPVLCFCPLRVLYVVADEWFWRVDLRRSGVRERLPPIPMLTPEEVEWPRSGAFPATAGRNPRLTDATRDPMDGPLRRLP